MLKSIERNVKKIIRGGLLKSLKKKTFKMENKSFIQEK